jgi:hypothetical protein
MVLKTKYVNICKCVKYANFYHPGFVFFKSNISRVSKLEFEAPSVSKRPFIHPFCPFSTSLSGPISLGKLVCTGGFFPEQEFFSRRLFCPSCKQIPGGSPTYPEVLATCLEVPESWSEPA